MRFTFLILTTLFTFSINANFNIDSILIVLDNHIDNKNIYHQTKVNRLDSLKNTYDVSEYENNVGYKLEYDKSLYNEYKLFIYDSAFVYARKVLNAAELTGNQQQIALAKIDLAFTLLSAGLFKETLDTLASVKTKSLESVVLREYFALLGRTYFDLADYAEDSYYSQKYEITGQQYHDSALHYCDINSQCYLSLLGLKNLRLGNITQAKKVYNNLLSNFSLSLHDLAVESSSMAHIFNLGNDVNGANYMLAQAAIADIQNSTKETIALRNLANNLFQSGEVERAYRYINLALEDAYFYEARHRKMKISDILPHIEKEQLRLTRKQKQKFQIYAYVVSALSLVIIFLSLIIFKQINHLKQTRNKLALSNSELSDTNNKLREVNKIKEEYIGHAFNVYSDFIEKIEKLKKSISRRLVTNNYQDIKDTIRSIDLKKERDELYTEFDKSFIKLFPNFISEFNKLFKEEDKIVLEKDQILSPEVRIFALIRLGITENERIAQVLNYSLNTIYTYKTKTKNKSIVENDEFEDRIMEIRAV